MPESNARVLYVQLRPGFIYLDVTDVDKNIDVISLQTNPRTENERGGGSEGHSLESCNIL